MNSDMHIEQEVQRRTAALNRQHHEDISVRDNAISELTNTVLKLSQAIQRLEDMPFYFGMVIKVENKPDAYRFQTQDDIVVVDEESGLYGLGGKIISNDPVVSPNGTVEVELSTGVTSTFSIGTESPAQIHLVNKSDGTRAIINIDSKPWEVRGAPELGLQVGHVVKIHSETKQIISLGEPDILTGPIVTVDAITQNGVEISDKGEKKLVFNTLGIKIEEGDRVVVDSGYYVILKKLAQDPRNRYKLSNENTITWDKIGGLEDVKARCKEAIELPYQHPEKFAFYGKKPASGILLYGPAGCGKTLVARAIATSLMKTHVGEADVLDTGYIYVKSPEILDKWVGNSEAEIRRLFERGRQHFRKHGYKAVLAFDEIDAIAAARGSRQSSDVTDTIVPMFLGEMSGADEVQNRENPLIVAMTNRAEILDPAFIRDGRFSEHIKVGRPTPETTVQILDIHTKDAPFVEVNKKVLFAIICQDIFSKSRLIYRINNEHEFTFGDCINGAMIEGICERAKMYALKRDIQSNTQTGLSMEDFQLAVQTAFESQNGLNHSADLFDFSEKIGIQAKDMKISKCFGAA
jgi:ATP-dependent 26S proteasome regulatory subunit